MTVQTQSIELDAAYNKAARSGWQSICNLGGAAALLTVLRHWLRS